MQNLKYILERVSYKISRSFGRTVLKKYVEEPFGVAERLLYRNFRCKACRFVVAKYLKLGQKFFHYVLMCPVAVVSLGLRIFPVVLLRS